jgi:DNA-binding MarR family transcriptional regulator
MDMMREFGAMTFASRLKRLGDHLKAEATKIYRANGIEFNDSWFLVAFMLADREDVSITDIASEFGVSHAAISQMAAAMERKGLLSGCTDQRDRRRTLLSLTPEGRRAVESLRPLWKAVGVCTNELIDATSTDLLGVITTIESQLKEKSLFTRVSERIEEETGD